MGQNSGNHASFLVEGPENTDRALRAACQRSLELGLKHVAVASTTGRTGLRALAIAADCSLNAQIIVVGEHYGYHGTGSQLMPEAVQQQIKQSGGELVFATHALSSAERSLRLRHGGIGPLEIMAETLRRFSRGVKAGVEMAIMLADGGLVGVADDICCIGGSGGGADSAIIVRPAASNDLFSLSIREIVAMPRYRTQEVVEKIISLCERGCGVREIGTLTDFPLEVVSRIVAEMSVYQAEAAKGRTDDEIKALMNKGQDTIRVYSELLRSRSF